MGMPDEYDRDCEECGCFGGSQITFCEECLKARDHNKFVKLKNLSFEFFRDELAYDGFIKRFNEIAGTQFTGNKSEDNPKSI